MQKYLYLKKLLKLEGWKRRVYFVGILTKALQKFKIRPVVVGGHALEFYTLGGYTTGDIDLVIPGLPKEIDKILKDFGFEKIGRHWDSEEFDIAVEVPASTLDGDYERILKANIEGLKVYFIGIEDLIIDRLNAYVFWKSEEDGLWAENLMRIHKSKVDWKYLRKRCQEENTLPAFQRLRRKIWKKR